MTATTPPRPKQLDSPILPKIFKYAGRAQVWVYRRTGGRIGGKWRIGAGFRKPVPTLLLEHRGRKSGTVYTVPLLYIADGDDIVIVASQGGLAKHPQWYRNLRAHPDTHIQIGRDRRAVHAVTADPQQRARLWPLLLEAYADFETYQAWTEREIPVVILRPGHATA
ncbi:nitroreductase family deazaflavin-dependent oxidoreductase [Nocardia blacklockiae]|uniref:nitroreductase family deazaflavin-dependent oxidoreductase n=1 Tax=Nocardia blacklockiae TaxID=480036 RepID=UPI001895864B|nr:nitroreductase family deazaflavin-dependent oxidoreductase [Nocardia blacklockiae]MBF6173779.1 nitroreductase family deazaflavin-dependent oxidoreductase [Nocardia blacklockiae]